MTNSYKHYNLISTDFDEDNTNISSLPIGVYDSGIGGLSVLCELIKCLPHEQFIYFADTKNLPYGSKTKTELIDIATHIFNFYESFKVKAVVMACNTTSSVVYQYLKNKYNFSIYPIIQTCTKEIAKLNIQKLAIFATILTIKSNMYKNLIQAYNPKIQVLQKSVNSWVQIIENQQILKQNSLELIKKDFEAIDKFQPDKIILGCTHFPFLQNVFTDLFKYDPNIFINPAKIFALNIKHDLKQKKLLSVQKLPKENIFFTTSNPENFKIKALNLANINITNINLINLENKKLLTIF